MPDNIVVKQGEQQKPLVVAFIGTREILYVCKEMDDTVLKHHFAIQREAISNLSVARVFYEHNRNNKASAFESEID